MVTLEVVYQGSSLTDWPSRPPLCMPNVVSSVQRLNWFSFGKEVTSPTKTTQSVGIVFIFL